MASAWRRYAMSAVLATAVAIAAGPMPTAAGGGGGATTLPEGCAELVDVDLLSKSATSIVVATVLIILGISFERMQHYLIHSADESLTPVIDHLFEELTLLGFIGLVLFAVESGTFLDSWSLSMYGGCTDSHTLVGIVHNVHMVLFLVMVIFLVCVLVLIKVAQMQTKSWRRSELMCVDKKALVMNYIQYVQTKNSRSPIMRLLCCCCRGHERARQDMAYNAFRSRFIHPDQTAGESKPGASAADLDHMIAASDGVVRLSPSNARLYRKKLVVYAFPTRDAVTFTKHWGTSAGKRGDMVIIGSDQDLYVCGRKLFEKTYQPVPGEPNKFRKVGHMWARKMMTDFKVHTEDGSIQKGSAGSYLVQNDDERGAQYTVTGVEFETNYEFATADSVEASRHSEDLPYDFDFGAYLSVCLGDVLAKIVTVSLPTWIVVELVLLLLWGVFAAVLAASEDKDQAMIVLHVAAIVSGCGLVLGLWLAHLRLKHAEHMLLPSDLLTDDTLENMRAKALPKRLMDALSAKPNSVVPLGWTSNEETGDDGADAAGAGAGAGVSETRQGGGGDDDASRPPSSGLQKFAKSAHNIKATVAKSAPGHEAMGLSHHTKHIDMYFDQVARTSRPKYLDLPVAAQRSSCWKCLGRIANRHQQLFWFDRHGPAFMMHFIRAGILILSVYVAATAVIITEFECADTWSLRCITTIIFLVLPPGLAAWILPGLIMQFVLVSKIEMLKSVGIANEILRQQRTQKSLRALKLLAVMRKHAARSLPALAPAGHDGHGGHGGHGDHGSDSKEAAADADEGPDSMRMRISFRGAAAKLYGGANTPEYIRRRAELFEAFSIFDRQSTGSVSSTNMVNVLQLVGTVDLASEAAEIIVAELDADNSGNIEFQEFFDWMAHQESGQAKQSAHDLVHDIFHMIDRDHNGEITVAELRDTLSSLGTVMTPEDVMAIVRETDHDGNGNINIHEFEGLMSKHLANL